LSKHGRTSVQSSQTSKNLLTSWYLIFLNKKGSSYIQSIWANRIESICTVLQADGNWQANIWTNSKTCALESHLWLASTSHSNSKTLCAKFHWIGSCWKQMRLTLCHDSKMLAAFFTWLNFFNFICFFSFGSVLCKCSNITSWICVRHSRIRSQIEKYSCK
jgi:hypothetical protein